MTKKFYKTLTNDFERIDSKILQIYGIDCVFEYKGYNYLCDEKTVVRYINKPLSTFAFETSFINKEGEIMDGWLLNKNEINNSFMLVYIDEAKKDIIENIDDIIKVELILIKRQNIIKEIERIGYDIAKLKKKDYDK